MGTQVCLVLVGLALGGARDAHRHPAIEAAVIGTWHYDMTELEKGWKAYERRSGVRVTVGDARYSLKITFRRNHTYLFLGNWDGPRKGTWTTDHHTLVFTHGNETPHAWRLIDPAHLKLETFAPENYVKDPAPKPRKLGHSS